MKLVFGTNIGSRDCTQLGLDPEKSLAGMPADFPADKLKAIRDLCGQAAIVPAEDTKPEELKAEEHKARAK